MIPIQQLADIEQRKFTERRQGVAADVSTFVRQVIKEITAKGDEALRDFTWRLDGVDLASPWLDHGLWDELVEECPMHVREAIDGNLRRIKAFHELQRADEDVLEVNKGIRLGRRPVPYRAAACYVPGGRASYPSSVLMTVVPAVIAGVQQIIVVTPPRQKGRIDPSVAYAARAAGATAILMAGGAQAIAALAIGTRSVPCVDAIVGPGNAFVTAAKQALQDRVRIDSPAGPSELLVLADEGAPAEWIAADMMAQAEHAPDAQVVLITDSQTLAQSVVDAIRTLLPDAARRSTIETSMAEHGAILVADNWHQAVDFANAYAAEHLEIMSADPHRDLDEIRNAGSVFLGPYAPVSLGDYGSGTNHVLPTMGFARLTGGLSVDNFRKWITWQDVTKAGLAGVAEDITTLAEAEGLSAHADAVRRRL